MKRILFSLFAALALVSCEDFLDVPPQGVLLEDEALETAQDYEELLNSCYDVTANTYNGRLQNLFELLGDHLAAPNNNSDYNEVYNRDMLFFNSTIGSTYGEPYIIIYRANTLIERVPSSPLSDDRKTSVSGEAHFLRGMAHFELVRGWAQPFGFSPDNSHVGIQIKTSSEPVLGGRNTVAEVYSQVLSDLLRAEIELPDNNGSYATKSAAQALLAKVYFQMNDYAKAAEYANKVINSGLYALEDSTDRFLQNVVSSEAIFSTISRFEDQRSGTLAGNYRSDLSNANPTLRASLEFYNTYGLDTSDLRSRWIELRNAGQPNQYVAVTKFNKDYFNIPVLHLTDIKLIRAESLAILNQDLTTAIQDINDLRERAFGNSSRNLNSSVGAGTVLEAARYERRIEMLGEGDRVQDLKRLGASGQITEIRNSPWNCPGMVLQFPISEQTDLFELNETGGCN